MDETVADFSDKMKKAWLKSMEAIGNTAGNIADNTRYKVNEMNLLNRRREILSDFGSRAYALWQKGETFPEELARQLEELSQVDTQLNALRTERLAGIKTDAAPEETPAEEASTEEASTEEMPAKETPAAAAAPAAKSPLAEKADQAIDAIGNTLKNVGTALGSAISSVAGTLTGKKPDAPSPAQDEQPAAEDTVEAAETPAPQENTTADVPTIVLPPEETAAPDDEPFKHPEPPQAPALDPDDLEGTAQIETEHPDEYRVE